MLEENYVSFETAKLLKEKGFNEKCNAYFYHGHLRKNAPLLDNAQLDGNDFAGHPYEAYSAPTLQMAMNWLKTKGLYITTQYFRLDVGNDWATVTVYRMNKYGAEMAFEGYDVEELYDNAIKFCCENLI